VTLAQFRLLELSSNSRQIIARNSSEYMPFDEPETAVSRLSTPPHRGASLVTH
jgi:hypothetical protein